MNRIERAKTLPETLTLSEAAQFFRVSRPTLLKALKDGQVSGIKIGRNGGFPAVNSLPPPLKRG
jgi:excisionase family DNA binding protein